MRKLFLVLLLVLFPAAGWADEYVLVMSKEDNVCQHMLGLYNEDLRKYGEMRYDEHEEFTAIRWEGKKYYMMNTEGRRIRENDDIALISHFDINNDGKEEIVIKRENVWLSGIPSDGMYYFKNEDADYFKDEEFDVKILYTKAIGEAGTMSFKGNTYDLKELPKIPIGIISGKEAYSHYSLGGYFFVNPFVFKRAYYISMRAETPSSRGIFLVILQYTPDNKLKDICYYIKLSDQIKNKTQRRK